MHSGLINYSGVYRSAGSVFLSSSVLTYRYTWLSILYSGADPLFVFVLMKGCQMTFWLRFYFFLTRWSPVFSRKRECGYYFDVERGAQRCSHYLTLTLLDWEASTHPSPIFHNSQKDKRRKIENQKESAFYSCFCLLAPKSWLYMLQDNMNVL